MGIFDDPVCVAVTGAGRGFGFSLCLALAESLPSGSHLLLLGRNLSHLEQTEKKVLQVNRDIKVHIYDDYDCSSLDVSKLANFLSTLREKLTPDVISRLLVIHNAGTIGSPDTPSTQLTYATGSTYMNVNFAAMISTNNVFIEEFLSCKKTIVQITSLCGLKPFKSLGLYCAGN